MPTHQTSPAPRPRKRGLPAVALVALLAVVATLALPSLLRAAPVPDHSRVLRWTPYTPNTPRYVFGSAIPCADVHSVTFRDTTDGIPAVAWDASDAGDGTVWAWVTDAGNGRFDLVIAAEGGVRLPKDSDNLFRGYSHAVSIDFGGCVDTSAVTDMSCMFVDCESLTALDLRSFDTAAVTGMRNMFRNCTALTALDLSSFDTARVASLGMMFYNCRSLRAVTVSGAFVIPDGASTEFMFSGCPLNSTADFTPVD